MKKYKAPVAPIIKETKLTFQKIVLIVITVIVLFSFLTPTIFALLR
jgi:cytochrome c biogenesis factor